MSDTITERIACARRHVALIEIGGLDADHLTYELRALRNDLIGIDEAIVTILATPLEYVEAAEAEYAEHVKRERPHSVGAGETIIGYINPDGSGSGDYAFRHHDIAYNAGYADGADDARVGNRYDPAFTDPHTHKRYLAGYNAAWETAGKVVPDGG